MYIAWIRLPTFNWGTSNGLNKKKYGKSNRNMMVVKTTKTFCTENTLLECLIRALIISQLAKKILLRHSFEAHQQEENVPNVVESHQKREHHIRLDERMQGGSVFHRKLGQ